MPVDMSITLEDGTVRQLRPQTIRAMVAQALEDGLEWWKKNILPGHFTEAAHGKYGHQARSIKYTRRKLRIYGHGIDNMFTGGMAKQMLSSSPHFKHGIPKSIGAMKGANVEAAAGGSGLVSVTIVIPAPRHLYYYKLAPGGRISPDKVRELSTILPSELAEMRKVSADSVATQMETYTKNVRAAERIKD